MAKKPVARAVKRVETPEAIDLFARKKGSDLETSTAAKFHVLKPGKSICSTDSRAKARSPLDAVLHVDEGYINLWAENVVLRWKFNTASLAAFEHAELLKKTVRTLFSDAIAAWGDAVPIRFMEAETNTDFEIAIEHASDCTPQGCTLAQAFFPDAGQHTIYIFPTMFEQVRSEQVETLAHELGHVFGLRHYFALEQESAWPAVKFGNHRPFSIMNYGELSQLTMDDRQDLKTLYNAAWRGTLTHINRTPIKLVRPYHYQHP